MPVSVAQMPITSANQVQVQKTELSFTQNFLRNISEIKITPERMPRVAEMRTYVWNRRLEGIGIYLNAEYIPHFNPKLIKNEFIHNLSDEYDNKRQYEVITASLEDAEVLTKALVRLKGLAESDATPKSLLCALRFDEIKDKIYLKLQKDCGFFGHMDTFNVTPSGAILCAGPFKALFDVIPSLKLPEGFTFYSADMTTFFDTVLYHQRENKSDVPLLGEQHELFKFELLVSPLNKFSMGGCAAYGCYGAKAFQKDKGRQLQHCLLVEIPGPLNYGFYIPPPAVLKYSGSESYLKCTEAMMATEDTLPLQVNDRHFNVTSIQGLIANGIKVTRASDGKQLDLKDFLQFRQEWTDQMTDVHRWRADRMIDGYSAVLAIKTTKLRMEP